MKAENIHLNLSMSNSLNFSELTMEGLRMRGYRITQIVITHNLERKAGEPSMKIEYKVVHECGTEMMLDFGAVIVLATQAALMTG